MAEERLEILIGRDQIRERVAELAAAISRDYKGKDLLVLCVLKGAVIFLADLLRGLTVSAAVDFIAASSYDGDKSGGEVRLSPVFSSDVTARDVLVIEDIIDTGLTYKALSGMLLERRPASLRLCALLDKVTERRVAPTEPDYVGFVIGDSFVVGYGLDYRERHRNLQDICALTTQ
jgi:hypoxanthine phosphoribosyltransferase